jgi:hypothetical protein
MNELTEEQYDSIAAYLGGWMANEARGAFEEELRQNPALAEGVKQERLIMRGMRSLAFEKELSAIIQKVETPPTGNVPSPVQAEPEPVGQPRSANWFGPMRWVAAASVLLAVGIGIGWWLHSDPTAQPRDPIAQTDTLQQRQPIDSLKSLPPSPGPNVPDSPELLAEANTRILKQALAMPVKPAPPLELVTDVDADPITDTESIARDSAIVNEVAGQIAVGKITPSQTAALRDVVEQGYPDHWRAAAEWYLGVAYLLTEKPREGRAILLRIARTKGHPYQAEASRLRKQLRL